MDGLWVASDPDIFSDDRVVPNSFLFSGFASFEQFQHPDHEWYGEDFVSAFTVDSASAQSLSQSQTIHNQASSSEELQFASASFGQSVQEHLDPF